MSIGIVLSLDQCALDSSVSHKPPNGLGYVTSGCLPAGGLTIWRTSVETQAWRLVELVLDGLDTALPCMEMDHFDSHIFRKKAVGKTQKK
ncbi:MAG: hypothetical protein JXR32_04345 [Anaerolineaceae bacterium]|nr:hypothetical protein [Anaerolineaceae bacterium]